MIALALALSAPVAAEEVRVGVFVGNSYGETDELGYAVAQDPVHVHDFNATILHLLGLDHERLTYRFQGRDYRLTDVAGKVVRGLLA